MQNKLQPLVSGNGKKIFVPRETFCARIGRREKFPAGENLRGRKSRRAKICAGKVLDKWGNRWYHNRARVGRFCACTAMMREIALKNGNFRGVCPVIGRLNCFWKRWRISPGTEEGSASVGHFSWLGMIRTAARTNAVRPYPDTTQTEYVIQGGKQTWQTR